MQPGSLSLRFALVLLVAAAVWAGAASLATRLAHSRAARGPEISRVACVPGPTLRTVLDRSVQ